MPRRRSDVDDDSTSSTSHAWLPARLLHEIIGIVGSPRLAGRHHRRECSPGTFAALQQPLREALALAQTWGASSRKGIVREHRNLWCLPPRHGAHSDAGPGARICPWS